MASILDRYGIKEVADVTFYEIEDDGTQGKPVLYLDTLKVSTIEQTAETSDARGGKGNPKLITWDYGKDITVTLEDALFSPKSLAIMFGDGVVTPATGDALEITKTVVARATKDAGDASTYSIKKLTLDVYNSTSGKVLREEVEVSKLEANGITVLKVYKEDGTEVTGGISAVKDEGKYFVTYKFTAASKFEIGISAETFPGTYYVTGDTYARSDVNGEDQFFQFIIPKAKVTSENTITLEAEGDPSVFNMNLSVLRPESGDMMKLVQYTLA